MSVDLRLMLFCLDEQRYALALPAVQRVVAAVEVTHLPGAPAVVLGVINVAGEIMPVFNLRRRFQLAEREIRLTDQFVIAQTARRNVALVVDEAEGVLEWPAAEIIGAAQFVSPGAQIQGVIKLPDGLVLIHDLEQFLSADETEVLTEALRQEASHAS